ncbi:MAG: putative DNA binding domain-containing protein, partial [Candidatus Omnitrophica bacterium]|nr:putative DNA binding domain-containing protein [Candidatus Omnitrophota bacterium]
MNASDLQEILDSLKEAAGDTAYIEAKSAAGGFPKRLWETLSALANTPGGGVLILGWSESLERVEGVSDAKKIQQDLASLCDQMVPPLRPLIEIHSVEGKRLITAEIPEVSYKEKPSHYKGAGIVSGSFIRVADGNRQLTQYEVQGFLDGRGQPVYDMEPVPGAATSALSKELVRSYLTAVRRKFPRMAVWSDEKILSATRILVQKDGTRFPTLAGLLALGADPQRFFPGLSVHVLVYPREKEDATGALGERFVDNIKIEGPLLTMVPETIAAIRRNIRRRAVVKGLFREDALEYPELFFREAVTNALVHRDYSPLARGSAVQVKIFPDRIEIDNPGGLFGPVTVDRLGEQGLQASRNSFLIKILEDCPVPGEPGALCENRGSGILHMIQSLHKAGMEPPRFRDDRTYFRVTCFNNTLFNARIVKWLERFVSLDLSERQRYGLAYLKHRGALTNLDYCRINGCD